MHTRMLTAGVVWFLACTTATAQQARTDPPPPPANFRVLAAGGFLGQLDGFCEQPGGTYDLVVKPLPCGPNIAGAGGAPARAGGSDWPGTLGGLLGARSSLHARAKEPDGATRLIVITGNNQVPDFSILGKSAIATFTAAERSTAAVDLSRVAQVQTQSTGFWDVMAQVGADAVALGPEDFVRSLRRVESRSGSAAPLSQEPAQSFVEWVHAQPLPFLATNVVVRRHKHELNTVDSELIGGYTLSFGKNTSVDWHAPFSIEYPCEPEPQFVLRESIGASGTFAEVQGLMDPAPLRCDKRGKQTFAAGSLRPGRRYEVKVSSEGRALATLSFETHDVLTSHWNGLPVIMKTGPGGESLFIVAMVDAATKRALGRKGWEWESPKGDRHELDFLPPEAVLQAIAQRIVAGAPGLTLNGPPIIVLLSTLEDAGTLALLDAFPEIRVVVLPQDSALLGRASRESVDDASDRAATSLGTRRGTAPMFSGDLGFSAVLNAPQPSATTVVARPQWIGETIADLQAHAARNATGEWEFVNASARIETIPGAPLEAHMVDTDTISYRTTWEGQPYPLGTFQSYLRCATTPVPPECVDYRDIWIAKDVLDAVAGDAFRRTLRAELAVVPVDLVDDYVPRWLTTATARSGTDWISEFVLQRSIFRSHHAVRAVVAGDKLFETLSKIVDNPAGYCIVGIGSTCQRTLDKTHPERIRVNGRPVDSKLAYSIAIPDVLAETLALRHSDALDKKRDALNALDRHLADRQWVAPPRDDVKLPARLGTRANARPQSYFLMSGFEFGLTKLALGLPHVNGDARSNLDVDFRAAKPAETVTLKFDWDLAAIDMVRQALRVTGVMDYQRRNDADGVSFDRDEFTIGARFDVWKWHIFKEARPYLGYFIEGPYATHKLKVSAARTIPDASRPGFTTKETANDKTSLTIEPSRYWYYAAGLDITEAWKIPVNNRFTFTLSRIGLQAAAGSRDVPIDVFIAGSSQTLERYLLLGPTKLLEKYFDEQKSGFDSGVAYTIELRKRDQRRLQIDAATETVFKLGGRDFKFGADYRHRLYSVEDTSPLALKRTLKTVLKLTIPIWWRLEFVPTFEYQRARVQAPENNVFQSRRFDVLLKLPVVMKSAFGFFVN